MIDPEHPDEGRSEAAHRTHRQVDLPHHQHADDAQRNHADRRTVEQQVHQVVGREEHRVQTGEHGPDDDQARDNRQRSQIPRTHPFDEGRHGATHSGGVFDTHIAAIEQGGGLRSALRFRLWRALHFVTHDGSFD